MPELCVFPPHRSKYECRINRMSDPLSTKGLSVESVFHPLPPTPTANAASKSQDKDINAELREECVIVTVKPFSWFDLVTVSFELSDS